jgi:hypothetical protein
MSFENLHIFDKNILDMIVERINNELLIRIPGNMTSSRIQSIMDYLRYEELTANSRATQEDIDALASEAKKGRWDKIRKEIGL